MRNPASGSNHDSLGRRELLVHALGLAALGALAPLGLARSRPRRQVRLGTVLGAGRVTLGLEERNVFCALDLDDPEGFQRLISLDFYGHGLALDPLDPRRVVLFQKNGEGACELDLEAATVVQPIPTSPERHFYGHGAFSPDGSLLYATESVLSDRFRGVIVVRDGRTLEELGEFPSYGARPHDCVLRDEGRTLVVTNGGGRGSGAEAAPCVTYVDVPSRKLLERVPMGSPELNAGHLALTARGDLAVVSASAAGIGREGLGAVSLRPLGEPLSILEEPAEITGRMRGEALSVAIHEPSGIVGVTSPYGSLVTFWDLRRSRLVRSLDLALPRGIALSLDGSRFLISYGSSSSLLAVSTADLEPVPGSRRSTLNMLSSHIVVHRLPAA